MTISEAASKKKRGRPTVLPGWWDARVYRETQTTRGQQNRYYYHVALEILGVLSALQSEQPVPSRFAWLVDDAEFRKIAPTRRGAIKVGVLAEIGRFAEQVDVEAAIGAAEAICRLAPLTVKAAERMVRRWRLEMVAEAGH